MEESKQVIMSFKAYEALLSYLGTTQLYNDVAELISETVSDIRVNMNEFSIVSKASLLAAAPAPAKAELRVVKDYNDEVGDNF